MPSTHLDLNLRARLRKFFNIFVDVLIEILVPKKLFLDRGSKNEGRSGRVDDLGLVQLFVIEVSVRQNRGFFIFVSSNCLNNLEILFFKLLRFIIPGFRFLGFFGF